MVIEPLSEQMIDVGRKLTERLEEIQMPVSALLWLYYSEAEVWRLVIASPIVVKSGPTKAYQLIQSELRAAPEKFQVIALSEISAVEPNGSLVSPFRGLSKVNTPTVGKRLSRSTFNGRFVGGAYIYKLAWTDNRV